MARRQAMDRCLLISYLRCARKFFSNRELAEILELPEPVLSRYVTGKSLPNEKNSELLLEKIRKLKLVKRVLDERIEVSRDRLVNLHKVIFDTLFLRMASIDAYLEYRDTEIDGVVTAAVNGVPLATLVAETLQTDVCIAKRERDAGEIEYYSVDIIYPPPSPRTVSFNLPKKLMTNKKRVLVVDDLISSGRTLDALARLMEKTGSRIVGLYTLVAVGDEWKEKIPSSLEKIVIIKSVNYY
ncbi:MAG: hypothetical protein DRJ38_08670 [Thermoprotei archaeon]|nr:MAG: hypothetical protein DRJ38_08670 [Thermoprotei archaeon]